MFPWKTRNARMVAWLHMHGVDPVQIEQIEGSKRYNFVYAQHPGELADQFIDGLANPYHDFLNAYFNALGQAKSALTDGLATAPFHA